MANWKYELDLQEVFKNDDLSPKESLEIIIKKCKELNQKINDSTLESIIDDFETLQSDEVTMDEIDYYLHDLYDWGDHYHTCWIKTYI